MNKVYYFLSIEILVFVIYMLLICGYVSYMYDHLLLFDIGIVTLVVAPILSSITASYRYELKYHEFISMKNLITSSVLLYLPHVLFAGVAIYIFDDVSDWGNCLWDSVVVAAIQVLFIIVSVILFGRYVNDTLLKK